MIHCLRINEILSRASRTSLNASGTTSALLALILCQIIDSIKSIPPLQPDEGTHLREITIMPFSFARIFLGKKATVVDEDALPCRPREVVPTTIDRPVAKKAKFGLIKIRRALKHRFRVVSIPRCSQPSLLSLTSFLVSVSGCSLPCGQTYVCARPQLTFLLTEHLSTSSSWSWSSRNCC